MVEHSNRVSRPAPPRRIAWQTIAVVGLGVVTAALGGCSLAMQGPDPNWDGKQKPDCADSYAPVMIDAFTSGVIASTAIEGATDEKIALPIEAAIAAVGVALLYSASAASGAHKYNACRTAMAAWRAREAIRERNQRAARGGAMAAPPARGGAAAAQLRVAVASSTYFCVRAPSDADHEISMRERSGCEHVRDIMSLSGGKGCAPQDAAWCFDASGADRCFATRSACEIQRTRSCGGAVECSDRR